MAELQAEEIAYTEGEFATMVGVAVGRKGKSSIGALKWALENEVSAGGSLYLLHVQAPLLAVPTDKGHLVWVHQVSPDVVNRYKHRRLEEAEKIINRVYRDACLKRKVKTDVCHLEGSSIAKALVDGITMLRLSKLIVGKSSDYVFSRVLKRENIAAFVAKSAPEFCKVMVIQEGKLYPLKDSKHYLSQLTSGRSYVSGSSSAGSSRTDPDKRKTLMSRNYSTPPDGDASITASTTSTHQLGNYVEDESTITTSPSVYDISYPEIADSMDYRRHEDPENQNVDDDEFFGSKLKQARLSAEVARREAEKQTKDLKHAEEVVSEAARMVRAYKQELNDAKKQLEMVRMNADRQHASQHGLHEQRKYEEIILKLDEVTKMWEKETELRMKAEERASQEASEKQQLLLTLRKARQRYSEYTHQQLCTATNNFNEENKLGQGGYGPVYKGKLHHTTVAVKVLAQEGLHGQEEFQREVELLSSIHHPHLVMLVGACPEKACIVYEYM